ncbi:hypothetical protein [Dictyobacter kobayashii]|nr:hypothetical protein [Dictyobacter kobayashii]
MGLSDLQSLADVRAVVRCASTHRFGPQLAQHAVWSDAAEHFRRLPGCL